MFLLLQKMSRDLQKHSWKVTIAKDYQSLEIQRGRTRQDSLPCPSISVQASCLSCSETRLHWHVLVLVWPTADTFVMQIEGKDDDQPGTINSDIAYTIISQEPAGTGHMFTIDKKTGKLYVKEPTLDREVRALHKLLHFLSDTLVPWMLVRAQTATVRRWGKEAFAIQACTMSTAHSSLKDRLTRHFVLSVSVARFFFGYISADEVPLQSIHVKRPIVILRFLLLWILSKTVCSDSKFINFCTYHISSSLKLLFTFVIFIIISLWFVLKIWKTRLILLNLP